MERYPIPQFIEAEGKIISFLTFRQFFILVGGGFIALMCYYILPFYLFLLCAMATAALTAIIAFLKVDNVSVVVIFLNLITFLFASKNYTWKKKESPYPFNIKKGNPIKDMQSISEPPKSPLKSTGKIVEYRKKT